MRISDWSSDVCSSDLYAVRFSERSSALFGPMLVEKFLHSGLGLGTASAAFREQGDADALADLLFDTQERRPRARPDALFGQSCLLGGSLLRVSARRLPGCNQLSQDDRRDRRAVC